MVQAKYLSGKFPVMFFLRMPRPGGEPRIFLFWFIFSLKSSALDHSATEPQNFILCSIVD